MASDTPAAPDKGGAHKISPRDVASTTAVGSAARLGVVRHKAKVAEGAAAGVAGKGKRSADANSLKTALLVAALTIGTLVVMIVFGK
jgi:hypothetical protein